MSRSRRRSDLEYLDRKIYWFSQWILATGTQFTQAKTFYENLGILVKMCLIKTSRASVVSVRRHCMKGGLWRTLGGDSGKKPLSKDSWRVVNSSFVQQCCRLSPFTFWMQMTHIALLPLPHSVTFGSEGQAWFSWSERGTVDPGLVVGSSPSKTREIKFPWIWTT